MVPSLRVVAADNGFPWAVQMQTAAEKDPALVLLRAQPRWSQQTADRPCCLAPSVRVASHVSRGTVPIEPRWPGLHERRLLSSSACAEETARHWCRRSSLPPTSTFQTCSNYTSTPCNSAIRSSTGGCVLNNFETHAPVACAPNGFEIKRCAVVVEARAPGAPDEPIFFQKDGSPPGGR